MTRKERMEKTLEVEKPSENIEEKARSVGDVKPEATQNQRRYWEVVKWKSVVEVLKCSKCGHCEDGFDRKDKMILHVLTHYGKSAQEKLFNELVKE